MIQVLIVEDDFRVAQIHRAFTERVSGFRVVGTARTGQEARDLVGAERPDLLLLDTYLPDESGLDLLRDLDTDAIMLTAASDAVSVRTAFTRGALNYLVKPFTAEQLTDRLTAYRHYRSQLARDRGLAQDDIDRALRVLHDGDHPVARKGQSAVTFRLVADALREAGEPRSAADIAARLGIARATAQRYLAALAQAGSARMNLRYGMSGRPEHLYTWSD
ncbi:response regulator [Planosporangium mesophilum]|uniref:Transcriptional regulatory protein n=1 Tax=Planosporangium mesophilum TaxID=689768 RepID=A0A8J3X2K9_9ACTN|nr:response regulator [Planosporangium mesophilum]NJC84325.1 response regulator [Planosporangium mesophilum]GII25597.1 transcriptional regulatory protein [Planosporangium mesophilum]